MKTSKGLERARRHKKSKEPKKAAAGSHLNSGHIHTCGNWVSEVRGVIRDGERGNRPSFKQPSL
jgi:hypothetical protein